MILSSQLHYRDTVCLPPLSLDTVSLEGFFLSWHTSWQQNKLEGLAMFWRALLQMPCQTAPGQGFCSPAAPLEPTTVACRYHGSFTIGLQR